MWGKIADFTSPINNPTIQLINVLKGAQTLPCCYSNMAAPMASVHQNISSQIYQIFPLEWLIIYIVPIVVVQLRETVNKTLSLLFAQFYNFLLQFFNLFGELYWYLYLSKALFPVLTHGADGTGISSTVPKQKGSTYLSKNRKKFSVNQGLGWQSCQSWRWTAVSNKLRPPFIV